MCNHTSAHNQSGAIESTPPHTVRHEPRTSTTRPTSTAMSTELIDEMATTRAQGYELQRTYRFSTENQVYKLQITIRRDSYQSQSHATARMLSADLKWEPVASEATALWYDASAHHTVIKRAPSQIVAQLAPIADRLLTRAITILS